MHVTQAQASGTCMSQAHVDDLQRSAGCMTACTGLQIFNSHIGLHMYHVHVIMYTRCSMLKCTSCSAEDDGQSVTSSDAADADSEPESEQQAGALQAEQRLDAAYTQPLGV